MDTTTNKTNNIDHENGNPTLIGQTGTNEYDTFRFTHEGTKMEMAEKNPLISDEQLQLIGDPVSHEIADFMRRPIVISEGSIGTDLDVGHVIDHMPVVEKLRESKSFEKLKGFFAITATFCFKVVLSPQPTVQGAIMAYFKPRQNAQFSNDNELLPFHDWRQLLRDSVLPGVVMNYSATSEADFKVQYRAVEPLLRIQSGTFGDFMMRIISRTRGASNGEHVPYVVYMWLEDLRTYGTAPYVAATFQGMSDPKIYKGKEPKESSVQEAKRKQGPISGIADTVGDIASALTAIPVVSDIAGPVSWLAKGVSSVASMFGFSKPSSIDPSIAMTQNPFKDFAHGNGVLANATKLTVHEAAETKVRPLGPTDEDEMSIGYLLNKPTYFDGYEWTNAMAVRTKIAEIPIRPSHFYQNWSLNTHRFYVNTTLSYLSEMFLYWRGTINLTFLVVATKFHSGRLRFVYTPTDVAAGAREEYAYSHIVDIRDGNTFTISVPYMSVDPWLRKTSNNGRLAIYVETELQHPEAISSSVEVVCMVSASDFMFAGPSIDQDYRVVNGVRTVDIPAASAELQGFTDTPVNNAPAKVNITNTDALIDSTKALEHAIGDPIVNLRTLVKRFTVNSSIKKEDTTNLCFQTNAMKPMLIKSWTNAGDYIDAIAPLYAFRSGGFRFALTGPFNNDTISYKYVPVVGKTAQIVVRYRSGGALMTLQLNTNTTQYDALREIVRVPYSNTLSGALICETPFYTHHNALYNGRSPTRDNTNLGGTLAPYNTEMNVVVVEGGQAGTYELYRAGADDFNCGFFTGAPMTIYLPYVPT